MKRALQIFRNGQVHESSLRIPLMPGEQGNLQTLEAMRDVVLEDRLNPYNREFVTEYVINGVPGHDPWGELEAIFNFANDRIVYREDPFDVERVMDLYTTLRGVENDPDFIPEGDCGVKSMFIATCAAILGHKPYFAVLKQDPNSDVYTHVFTAVGISTGEWRYYDATPEDSRPGWHAPGEIKWFAILDE